MSELQAITGQLYIKEGIIQETSPDVGVPGLIAQPALSRPARGRDKDFLLAHLTLTGQNDDTAVLAQQLLSSLSQKFFNTSGSVTAALRTAVLEVNEQLLRFNVGSNAPAREGAITCSVFRQGELFTVQAGESIALLGHNYGIERLPPKPPVQITPLGRSRGMDIRFYHHRLQSGDVLLLADPRLSHIETEEFAPALVESHIEQGLEQLTAVIGSDSARLLLVEFSADTLVELPEVSRIGPAAVATAVPTPQPRRETPTPPPPAGEERKPQPQPQRARPVRQEPVTPPPSKTAVDKEVVERHARQAGSKAALGASKFTAWLADLMTRLRPPHQEQSEEKVNWTWAAIIAVIIPFLVAAIVTSVYVARDQAQYLADIKTEMAQKLVLAEDAPTNGEARQQYVEILALAEQAGTEINPTDAEINRMRNVARDNLDKLDGVTRLSAEEMYTYSEGTILHKVALRDGFNGGIFTLDVGNGIVYEHETDETYLNLVTGEPLRVLFSGGTVGSHVVGTVVDFFWRPIGFAVSREGLAMLDRDGALLTFQPSIDSTFAVPLDLSVDWVNPIATTDFDERLYILDTGAQQIWKYFPEGEDFYAEADQRTIVFNEDPDLANAVDFDLYSEDGSLVILYNDGRIRYYDTRNGRVEWDEATLLENGLNVPLSNPTSVEIVGKGLNATVFIADAGNGRVVQVSRPTGQVLAQYRATGAEGEELFNNIADFAVAELPLRLFVVKGDTLYSTFQE